MASPTVVSVVASLLSSVKAAGLPVPRPLPERARDVVARPLHVAAAHGDGDGVAGVGGHWALRSRPDDGHLPLHVADRARGDLAGLACQAAWCLRCPARGAVRDDLVAAVRRLVRRWCLGPGRRGRRRGARPGQRRVAGGHGGDGEGAGQQRDTPADADPAARALRPLDRCLAERHRAQRPVQVFSQVIHRRPPSTMSAPRSSPGAAAFLRRVASARDAWLLTVPTEQLSAAAVSASDRSSQ